MLRFAQHDSLRPARFTYLRNTTLGAIREPKMKSSPSDASLNTRHSSQQALFSIFEFRFSNFVSEVAERAGDFRPADTQVKRQQA